MPYLRQMAEKLFHPLDATGDAYYYRFSHEVECHADAAQVIDVLSVK